MVTTASSISWVSCSAFSKCSSSFLHSISIPSHFYSDHTVYHSPFPSSHPANHMCLPLTLAQTTTLLPGPISIPEELLRLILYGNVKGIPDIWVVKVPHRKHLGKSRQCDIHYTTLNLKDQVCRRIYDSAFLSSIKSPSSIFTSPAKDTKLSW